MSWKVHVIPHMHWDREWYFTTEESRILLVNNMEEILKRLEEDKDYNKFNQGNILFKKKKIIK